MFGDNTVEHLAGIKDHYGDALANLIATSQGIASLPSTGTIQGNKLVGDGTSLVQVFEKSTGVLGPIEFEKIPEGATIIINVPDSGSVDVGTDAMDGYLYPPSSLGNTTINVLWNIPNANSVTIGGTQSIGSFLVGSPESHTTMAAPGSNGRIFVAGDLLQTGNEIHNYPFAGIIPNFEPEPDPAEGTFTIKKEIVGSGADQVPGDTEFEVEYTVNDGDPQTLTIRADGTVINGPTLKEGDTVGFKELKPDTLEDLLFTRSTITVDGQETDELTITDDGTAEVVVTNTYERQIPLILKKVVQGDNPGDETEYEGNFNVAHDYGGGYGSPFVIKNGEEARIGSVSVGSQVRLTENAIDIPGYTLESAVFSSDIEGAQLIDEGYNFTAPDTDEVLITLTNTFAADQPATGGFSLAKAVDADGDFPANQSFTFDVKIGNDPAQTVILGSNETSKVFDEIDDGTQVTISESAPTVSGYEWDGVNYSGTDGITVGNSFTFTIGENDDFEIVATNTFTPEDPLDEGEYTVTVNATIGSDPDLGESSAASTFTVAGGGGGDAGGGDGDLPDTGTSTTPLIIGAILLLLGGGAAMITVRARRNGSAA